MYLLDVLGDMCAVRAVAASKYEIAAVHACLLACGGRGAPVRPCEPECAVTVKYDF